MIFWPFVYICWLICDIWKYIVSMFFTKDSLCFLLSQSWLYLCSACSVHCFCLVISLFNFPLLSAGSRHSRKASERHTPPFARETSGMWAHTALNNFWQYMVHLNHIYLFLMLSLFKRPFTLITYIPLFSAGNFGVNSLRIST